jgi:protoheme IX farnesyltransferase
MSAAAGTVAPPAPAHRGRVALLGAYVRLTKPGIVGLLLVTTVPAMVLASRGIPSPSLVALTLVGGMLSAGGANAVNQFLDRDIDRMMRRTRRRPLPARVIEPPRALAFGLALGAAGFALLWWKVNLLAAGLALGAYAFYVLVYTAWLKRSSPQNIVIGGAAGAVPALVGWAAVTGRVGWPAVVLFVVVFLWTPPHFWALSLLYRRDYEAAGVPMLPVVAGREATARQILAYAVATAGASLALWPVARTGPLYPAAAAVLGALFVAAAWRVRRAAGGGAAVRLFRFSIAYLAALSAAVVADTVLRFGR